MGLVTTVAKYCFLECDRPPCNRRMEISNEQLLEKLTEACDWQKRGDLWFCPDCVEEMGKKKYLRRRPRRTSKAA